jgi:hypothetical protein
MPIRTNIYTHTRQYTHTHTHALPHTRTRTGETYKEKPLPPQAPRDTTRHINPLPPPRKPFANQLAVPTPTRTALTNKKQPTPTSAISSRSKYRPSPFSLALFHQPTFLPRTHAQLSPSTLSITPFH